MIVIAKSLASSGKAISRGTVIVCPLNKNQSFKHVCLEKNMFFDGHKTLVSGVFLSCAHLHSLLARGTGKGTHVFWPSKRVSTKLFTFLNQNSGPYSASLLYTSTFQTKIQDPCPFLFLPHGPQLLAKSVHSLSELSIVES